MPSIPGIQISRRTRSGDSSSMIFKASYPLSAVRTSNPSSERMPLNDCSMVASSSTANMVGNTHPLLIGSLYLERPQIMA